jgi:flagellar biosynthesis protein FliR
MADKSQVASSSTLLRTGRGQMVGFVITCSSTAALATFYDNTSGSGTKIIEAHVSTNQPLVIFFTERFAPYFTTGLYLSLASNLTVTVWWREL